jgi:hypothetical protein
VGPNAKVKDRMRQMEMVHDDNDDDYDYGDGDMLDAHAKPRIELAFSV